MKDLDKLHVMAKSETGFFKFIVRPLWKCLSDFFNNELDHCVNNLDNTIIQWERIFTEYTLKEAAKKEKDEK